jgi:biopolymer transport protein ExbD
MAFAASNTSTNSMSDINVTPLVDVMLVLLIIFMVTAPLLDNRQPVTLPQRSERPPVPTEPRVLQVEAGDTFTLDGMPMTTAQLESTLRDWRQAEPDGVLKVDVDPDADYQSAASAMAAANRAGIDNIGLAGL